MMKEGRRGRREGREKKKEEEVERKEKMKEKIIFYHDDGPIQLFVNQYLINMNIAPKYFQKPRFCCDKAAHFR